MKPTAPADPAPSVARRQTRPAAAPEASDASAPRTRHTPEGREKYCTRCDEWWPDTAAFFWPTTGNCCKACYMPAYRPERQARRNERDAQVAEQLRTIAGAMSAWGRPLISTEG